MWALEVEAEGYCDLRARAVSGAMDVRLTILACARVSGIVTMADGTPVAGARVSLERTYECDETDSEGRFDLPAVDPRATEIWAVTEHIATSQELLLSEGGTAGVHLVLSPRSRSFVRVRVLDAGGNVIPNAKVGDSDSGADTDPAGVATLAVDRPPGTDILLFVEAARHVEGWVETRTLASPGTPVDAVLRDAVPVVFRVREEDGTPLQALLRVYPHAGRENASTWWVDPFEEYTVEARADGFLPFFREGCRSTVGGDTVDVVLRPTATVRGRVTDALGAPLREVVVELSTQRSGRTLECGPDGEFVLKDLPEGSGVLVAGASGSFPGAAVEVTTASGVVTDVGTITVAPHVVLTGRIIDSLGRPLGGAAMRMVTELADTWTSEYSYADGTFRVAVPGFVGGFLRVSRLGFGTVHAAIAPGPAREVGDIVLPQPGSVVIDVPGDDDVDELRALLLWPGPDSSRAVEQYTGRRIDDVAPGRYVARVVANGRVLDQPVDVVAGETTTVTFRLER